MGQNEPRAAAPVNAEPCWPAGYMAVLREAGAQEKAIPYCVGWVQRFFAGHSGRRRPDLGRGEIEAFLAEVARHPGVSNWQVQQARDALELYYEQFRGIALEPRPETPTAHGVPPAGTEATSLLAEPHASSVCEPLSRADVAEAHGDYGTPQTDVKAGAPQCCSERPPATSAPGTAHGLVGNGREPRPLQPPEPPAPRPERRQETALGEPTTASSESGSPPSARAAGARPEGPLGGAGRAPYRRGCGRGSDPAAASAGGGQRSRGRGRADAHDADVPAGRPGSVNWSAPAERTKETLRVEHYSYRTEQTYLAWIRRYVAFSGWRKPSTLGAGEVREFLRHLAMDAQVSSSTQDQALNAVVFLYNKLIQKDIGDFSDFRRARRGLRLPVVAGRAEEKAVLERPQGRERLVAGLLYGTGMRIEGCLGMRVQDIRFDQDRIVAHGKGNAVLVGVLDRVR
jgi:hypothetical protein